MTTESVLRRGGGQLLSSALAVADCAWLEIWAAILATWIGQPADGSILSGWWILALILIGRGTTRIVRRIEPRTVRSAVAALTGLLAILLATRLVAFPGVPPADVRWIAIVLVRPDQVWSGVQNVDLVLLISLVSWIRGTRLGRGPSGFEDVQGTFLAGLIALGTALFFIAIVPASKALSSLGTEVVIVYLGAGMLSVALARIDEINGEQRRNQDLELRLGVHWTVTLALVLIFLLVFASALSGVLTLDRVSALLRPVGVAVDFVLEVVIYAIAIPIGLLLEGIIWLVRMLLGRPAKAPQAPKFINLARQASRGQQTTAVSPELTTLFHLLGGMVLVVVIGLALYRSISWWSELERVEGVPEWRDFVVGWGDLRAAVLGWIARLFRRVGALGIRQPMATAASEGGQSVSGRSIREIYRDFLRLGQRAGFPRQAAQTPLEYARKSASTRPDLTDPLDRLTRRYVAVRYGEVEMSEEMVADSQLALEQIRLLILEEPHFGEDVKPMIDKRASD